jgi:DNA-binding response OmpR family regulator
MASSLCDQKILIVEDHEGVRKALRVVLCPFYCVDIAETACAALKIILERPIDLVIMDVGLPDYDGIELLRRVRAGGRDVKVIVTTGRGSIESAKAALLLGAVAYLLKPFNFSELLALVEDGLKAKNAKSVSVQQ